MKQSLNDCLILKIHLILRGLNSTRLIQVDAMLWQDNMLRNRGSPFQCHLPWTHSSTTAVHEAISSKNKIDHEIQGQTNFWAQLLCIKWNFTYHQSSLILENPQAYDNYSTYVLTRTRYTLSILISIIHWYCLIHSIKENTMLIVNNLQISINT